MLQQEQEEYPQSGYCWLQHLSQQRNFQLNRFQYYCLYPFMDAWYSSTKFLGIRHVCNQCLVRPKRLHKLSPCFFINFLLLSWFVARAFFFLSRVISIILVRFTASPSRTTSCLRSLSLEQFEFLQIVKYWNWTTEIKVIERLEPRKKELFIDNWIRRRIMTNYK